MCVCSCPQLFWLRDVGPKVDYNPQNVHLRPLSVVCVQYKINYTMVCDICSQNEIISV